MASMDRIKNEVWVGWFGAVVIAAISTTYVVITFAYAQFETKEHAKESKDDLRDQLNRMEKKIDEALMRQYREPAHSGH